MSERPAPEHAEPVPAGPPDSTVPPPPPPSQPTTASGKGRRKGRAWSIGPPAHLLQRGADPAAGSGDDGPGEEPHHRHGRGGAADSDEAASPAAGQRETSNWRDASLLRNLLGS